jgi:hypothetical protein
MWSVFIVTFPILGLSDKSLLSILHLPPPGRIFFRTVRKVFDPMAAKSKCHVCDQRKGKRQCPARSAPICPVCCAQNRVVKIDCPADCSFLGAEGSMLLAARDQDDAPLPTAEDIAIFAGELAESAPRGRFMEDVEPTAAGALQKLFEFVDDQDEDATVENAVWEWVVFGARDVDGLPLVDRLITRLPRALTAAERSSLRGLHDSRYGLFTIGSYPTKDTAQVTDLLSDEPLELHLESIEEHHDVGKTIACFITRTQTGLEVVSGAWEVPDGAETKIPVRLREIRDESPLKETPLPEFLNRLSILVPLLLFEHFGEQESGDPDFPPPSF